MRVLLIVHQRDAGAGVFAEAVVGAGHETVEWHVSEGARLPADLDAAIVFGGSPQVDEEHLYAWLAPEKRLLRGLIDGGIPLLGVCLGAQLLAEVAGGAVRRAAEPEIGWVEVSLTPEGAADPLLGSLPDRFAAFQWHHYEWLLPPGAVALARTPACLQAFRLEDSAAWGVQFHPEVTPQIVREWAEDFQSDPDAVRLGFDPAQHLAAARERLPAWMELGRRLFDGFLATAEAAAGPPAPARAARPAAPGPPLPRG